jgi:hypothetical protein
MKHVSNLLLAAAFAVPAAAVADTATAPDFSGTYACTGTDSHDGDFKATMTLTRDKKNSSGSHAGYVFQMKDDHTVYDGSAAAHGKLVAITFANQDASKKDFGTSIATVTEEKAGGFKFEKFYYEPEYKGGGHGVETCVTKR